MGGSTQSKEYDDSYAPECYTLSWMSRLPDNQRLAEMSIPGTHGTMAFYGGNAMICQTWSLTEQLEVGCRFLDIRFRRYGDTLWLYHGRIYQHGILMNDVIKPTADFLRRNNSETVIMNIQDEDHYPVNEALCVEQLVKNSLNNGASGMWLPDVPETLGEARGKILVVRNRWEGSFGKSLSSFDHIANRRTVNTILSGNINAKWDNVRNNLEAADRNQGDGKWYLTFSSGASSGAYPNSVAYRINSRLLEFFENRRGRRRWGVLLMDFPGAVMIRDDIINSNFDAV